MITKLKTLKVGQQATLVLAVLSATARETKAKKPYLQLELFDGTDKICGNYWDWSSGRVPEKNTIVTVTAQVTEYLGSMQLNIKGLSVNTEHHLSEFEPASTIDLADVYKDAYELASSVNNNLLRSTALAALETYQDDWLTIPGAKAVHHAFTGGTLVHSLSVAKIARAISMQIPDADTDLCTVGGLLHDFGKLLTYKMSGLTVDMTDLGKLYDHPFIGAEMLSPLASSFLKTAEDSATLMVLKHIILSHHGSLEHGAVVPPMCIEAFVVHAADSVDASTQQIIEASRKAGEVMWTDRVYGLDNKPQLTPTYIKQTLVNHDDELPFN